MIYALLSLLLWSTVAAAFKLALRELSPAVLVTAASAVSAAALWILAAAAGLPSRLKRWTVRDWGRTAALGLLNPCLYYLALFTAYDRLPAQVAQPLNYTWPLSLFALSVLTGRESPSGRAFTALMISLSGVTVIAAGAGRIDPGSLDAGGIAAGLASSLLWAAYWILVRDDREDDRLRLAVSFTLALPVLAASLVLRGETLSFGPVAAGTAIWIGLFEMGITFVLWSRALKSRPDTALIGNLLYLTPFLSLVFIRLVLGEPIYPTTPVGLLLITAGLALQRKRSP